MRKLILFSLFLLSAAGVWAQSSSSKNPLKKGKTLGLHFTYHDFATASAIKGDGLSSVLSKSDWMKTAKMDPGVALSLTSGLTDNLDIMTRVGATILSYPIPGKTGPLPSKLLLETDVNLNIKLLPDSYIVSPYVSVGAGASMWSGYGAAYIPVGAGLQVNLSEETFIVLQSQYRAPVTTNNGARTIFWGMGISTSLSK